jgi:hypothetical protein
VFGADLGSKAPKIPSPSTGEGKGGGEYRCNRMTSSPIPAFPRQEGRSPASPASRVSSHIKEDTGRGELGAL